MGERAGSIAYWIGTHALVAYAMIVAVFALVTTPWAGAPGWATFLVLGVGFNAWAVWGSRHAPGTLMECANSRRSRREWFADAGVTLHVDGRRRLGHERGDEAVG